MIECVDPFKFVPKCISYGILEGDLYSSGGSIFLTNEIKIEMVLPLIRNQISLNGVEVFEKLLKVLHSEPNYKQLADHMGSMYEALYYTTSSVQLPCV